MKYTFEDTKVYVCFYEEKSLWRNILARTKLMNCSIMFEREGQRVIVASSPSSRSKILDADSFHESTHQPKHVFILGTTSVCLTQLMSFLDGRYRGDLKSVVFWNYFGKYFFPTLLPRTCSLLTWHIMRLCGY